MHEDSKTRQNTSGTALQAALETCERDPVHIPGAIQPFGVMLCLDASLKRITRVSANTEFLLGEPPEKCLGAQAVRVLGKGLTARLSAELRDNDVLQGSLMSTRRIAGNRVQLQVMAYRSGGQVVVELEPEQPNSRYRWLSLVNTRMEQILQLDSETEVMQSMVEGIRELTGYDRAVLYIFDNDCNGHVEVESVDKQLPSLLHHHFPASDIPAQVREIYRRNSVRVIADCEAPSVPLQSLPEESETTSVDMSTGVLRAVAPIHAAYMHNMGTRSSMSIAIFSRSRLWGLVSCHNASARALQPLVRESAASLVKMASQRLFLLKADAKWRFQQAVDDCRIALTRELQEGDNLLDSFPAHAEVWLDLFRVQGIALACDDQVTGCGKIPTQPEIKRLWAWIALRIKGRDPWATRSLLEAGYPEAGAIQKTACAVMAMPLWTGQGEQGLLMLFRPEEKMIRPWAGNPDKSIDQQDDGRLSPRSSFATWWETVRGKGLDWEEGELAAARDLGDGLTLILSSLEAKRLNDALWHEQRALEQANRELSRLAYTDTLTGVMNRYHIEHLVQLTLTNAQRYRQPFSLLLFDIDNFKSINDTFGHDGGDRILVKLVEVVQAVLRECDQLGRWGGEEFLVLATETSLAGAMTTAERLRRSVEEADFNIDRPVTISIGVAEWAQSDSFKSLLVRADQAMYEAKKTGRNRVCSKE